MTAEMTLFVADTATPAQTEAAGARLAALLPRGGGEDYPVVALCGDLGVGKTAFVRGMAGVLAPGAAVHSPTYTVVNEYAGDPPLFHFDLYRLEGEDDLISIGYDDYLARGLAVIEWSERCPSALPPCHFRVTIEKTGETTRRVTAVLVGGPAQRQKESADENSCH